MDSLNIITIITISPKMQMQDILAMEDLWEDTFNRKYVCPNFSIWLTQSSTSTATNGKNMYKKVRIANEIVCNLGIDLTLVYIWGLNNSSQICMFGTKW